MNKLESRGQIDRRTTSSGKRSTPTTATALDLSEDLDRPGPGVNASPRAGQLPGDGSTAAADLGGAASPANGSSPIVETGRELPTIVELVPVTPEQRAALRKKAVALLAIGALKVARRDAALVETSCDLDLPEAASRAR